jgi:drug/metabolite transporter (DMT)-like permease
MWLLFGLAAAGTDAAKNVLAKHNVQNFDSVVVTWAWVFYSLIILIPVMFIKGVPQLDQTFWIAFAVRIVLDFAALLMYVESLKRTDLSLSLPMLALTPLFLLASGFVINGELPTVLGIFGVLLIVAGAYFLNFSSSNRSLFAPLQAITHNSGSLLMLGVAVLWGLTGSIHKLAILHSNPYFYTGLGAVTLAVLFTPLAWYRSKEDFKKSLSREYIFKMIPVGLLDGATVLTQFIGQSISLTVLVISLKRVSIVFSSLMGWYYFKEDIKSRIVPICLMVVGVICIAVS